MNNLFNQIEKIKTKILKNDYEEKEIIIVIAEGKYQNWNNEEEVFDNEEDTKILKIVSSENLDKYYNKAKNLQELRQLAIKNNFTVLVLPTTPGAITIKEIWRDYIL